MTCILSIDVGTKRFGIAVGQSITKTAQPLATLIRDEETQFWTTVERYINQWKPSALVVGKPLDKEGNIQDMTRYVFFFVQSLRVRYNLDIYWVDEGYTSTAAKSSINWKVNQHEKRALVDALCAKMIAEDWLRLTPKQQEEARVPHSIT